MDENPYKAPQVEATDPNPRMFEALVHRCRPLYWISTALILFAFLFGGKVVNGTSERAMLLQLGLSCVGIVVSVIYLVVHFVDRRREDDSATQL